MIRAITCRLRVETWIVYIPKWIKLKVCIAVAANAAAGSPGEPQPT